VAKGQAFEQAQQPKSFQVSTINIIDVVHPDHTSEKILEEILLFHGKNYYLQQLVTTIPIVENDKHKALWQA